MLPQAVELFLVGQEFSAEVKDVPAANHGHHIGGIKGELLIHCVRAGRDPGIGIRAGELDIGEVVRLCKLPAQLAGGNLCSGRVFKEVH